MACCPKIDATIPGIRMLTFDELEAEISAGRINSMVSSTACWRHYLGTWELKDGKLYLVDVTGLYQKTTPGPIFAEWVTTTLIIPEGEQLRYVHMGFSSVYEFERRISIENGLVTDERRIDNRGTIQNDTP